MTDNRTRPSEPDRALAERLAKMSIAVIEAMSDQEVAELMGATPEEFAGRRYDSKLWMRDLIKGAAYLPK